MMSRGKGLCQPGILVAVLLALVAYTQPGAGQELGSLTGTVTDARSGALLSNVLVSVAGLSTSTNSQGKYTITGIPPGTLRSEFSASPLSGNSPLLVQFYDESTDGTQRVTASANGFIAYVNNRVLIIPNDTVTLNFSMSPVLASGSLSFVLNWGADPRDLDSHMRTPPIGGLRHHVYYGNPGSVNDTPFVQLDHDVTTGYGPETITVYRLFAGTYQYYVHKYSGNGELTESNAAVQIYSDAGLVRTFFVPTVGRGNFWYVCDVDGATKNITVVNRIDSTEPGNLLMEESFIPKKSDPPYSSGQNAVRDTISSWLWSFGDGTTSTLQNPTHTYEQNGLYTVSLRITRDTAERTETKTNFITVGPAIQVILAGNAHAGSVQTVSVTPPNGFQTSSGWLFYRMGGATGYDSLSLDTTAIPYRGSIPASAVTIRGMEYYIVLNGAGQTRLTAPSTNPQLNPYRQQVKVGITESPVVLAPRTYRMIAVPALLSDASIRSVLVDDLGEYDGRRWRLFRWEDGSYAEHPNIRESFTPGTAFWLISSLGSRFDIDSALSVRSSEPYIVTLDTGWNQVANPFAFPVAWNTVGRSGRVKGPYYFDGTDYQVDTLSSLLPWEGYFVLNQETFPVTITVPPLESVIITTTGKTAADGGQFLLQLSAEVPGTELKDMYNVLGLDPTASEGEDEGDFPEPPPVSKNVHLSIVDGGKHYLKNFKPLSGEGQQWEVELSSDIPVQQIRVTFSPTGHLPEGFRLYIIDKNDFNIVRLHDNSFTVPGAGVRAFKVILGTEQYALEHSNGVPLVPLEYALEQNFPNPFNPSTTIRYQLKKRSNVTLEVYNLLGQRVKTLVNSEQVTGTYSVVWDGRNNAGNAVASGVYIYRLRAGEFTADRRLILIH